jgi:hypothetical protein
LPRNVRPHDAIAHRGIQTCGPQAAAPRSVAHIAIHVPWPVHYSRGPKSSPAHRPSSFPIFPTHFHTLPRALVPTPDVIRGPQLRQLLQGFAGASHCLTEFAAIEDHRSSCRCVHKGYSSYHSRSRQRLSPCNMNPRSRTFPICLSQLYAQIKRDPHRMQKMNRSLDSRPRLIAIGECTHHIIP